MQISFSYENGGSFYDHVLKVVSADGTPIEIYFDGLDADVIHINGLEFDIHSDDCKGLYVNFGSGVEMNIIPVSSVIQQANSQIEAIVSEVETESRDWDRHVQSFSQPSL